MATPEAVLDAGPLIHLNELEALDVLEDFTNLWLPEAVWQEVSLHAPQVLDTKNLTLQRTSAPLPSPELTTLIQVLSLHSGEQEAIALMQRYPKALFLTDDAAARLAAQQLGYEVHGTLGLLIRAIRQNLRDPDSILAALRAIPVQSTLYIQRALLDKVIAQLEETWRV